MKIVGRKFFNNSTHDYVHMQIAKCELAQTRFYDRHAIMLAKQHQDSMSS
jgi:hypothetical protein